MILSEEKKTIVMVKNMFIPVSVVVLGTCRHCPSTLTFSIRLLMVDCHANATYLSRFYKQPFFFFRCEVSMRLAFCVYVFDSTCLCLYLRYLRIQLKKERKKERKNGPYIQSRLHRLVNRQHGRCSQTHESEQTFGLWV